MHKTVVEMWNKDKSFGFARNPTDSKDRNVFIPARYCCKHIPFERGQTVFVADVEQTDKGPTTKRVHCQQCHDTDVAMKRMEALFGKGFRFDVGGKYPHFYGLSMPVAARSPVVVAFENAAINAIIFGKPDDEVTKLAISAAKEAFAQQKG